MASRRLRIKPIANVPLRRGKVNTENERSDTANGEDTNKLTLLEPKLEISSQPNEFSASLDKAEIKQSTSSEEVVLTSNLSHPNVDDTINTSTLNLDVAVTTGKASSLVAVKEEYGFMSESCKDAISNTTAVPSKKIPPGLVRKRVKPAVSISAVSRRPKELNKISNDEKESGSSLTQIDVLQDQDERKIINEKSHVVSPGSQKADKEFSVIGNKDIGAGIPGITQIIPTGTAIRPQHDNVIGSSTLVVGKGEAPQSVGEPDLPSEGAGSGDSIPLKPTDSKVHVNQRSRFIKPTPRIVSGIRVFHKPGENDESKKPTFSDPVPPHDVNELIIPEHGLSESKQIVSADESDDESRKSMSEASTITPPAKKSLEISRPRFVKPTPRFLEASARRNSIQSSASESEDESRRSIHSAASTITPPNKKQADLKGDEAAEQNVKEECPDSPEKKPTRPRRTQSSCTLRLAKARMEFQNKFRNKAPDRSRLTMFDLIFYNPTTNPMKSSEQGNTNKKPIPTINLDDKEEQEERLNEEQVDEPSAPDDTQKDKSEGQEEEEEDIAMPVPQVKVGPDGQIILDEKSLVIETTGVKKGREDLANSAVIVDYGIGSTGYGMYSKKINKKSRDWSKEETLKFYRALNTVGTDFSLMQSIFPKRTRQDLKVKYKKEDRVNRYLVEKALLNPLNFDLTDLEKELQKEEEEEREKTIRKLSSPPKRTKRRYRSKKGSFLTRSMNDADTGNKPSRKHKKRKPEPEEDKKTAKRLRALKSKLKGKESSLSSDEENELTYNSENDINYNYENDLNFNTGIDDDSKVDHDVSDSETAEMEYLTKPPKPTRSGRIPQPRKLVELEVNEKVSRSREKESSVSGLKSSLKNIESQPMPLEDLTNVESKTSSKNPENQIPPVKDPENQPTLSKPPENNSVPVEFLTNIEPGSLVVLATHSPNNPGHQVYKVFMVTPKTGDENVPLTVPLSSPLLDSMSSSFVNENRNSCNQPSASVGNVPEMSVKQSDPVPGQVGGFIPVVNPESLTNRLGQLLPVRETQPVSVVQTEKLSEQKVDELVQLVSVESPTSPCAVLSQQQTRNKITDELNNPLSVKEIEKVSDHPPVQQIQSQSSQQIEPQSLVENGT